jgi:hypothetical protein
VPRQTDLELELHRRSRGPLIERALQASHHPAEPFDLGPQFGNEVRARFDRRSGWPVGLSSQSAERLQIARGVGGVDLRHPLRAPAFFFRGRGQVRVKAFGEGTKERLDFGFA